GGEQEHGDGEDELKGDAEREEAGVFKKRDKPVEERRVEVRQRRAGEVGVSPAEGIGEDGLAVDASQREVAAAVPRLREGAAPELDPEAAGEQCRKHCDEQQGWQESPRV